jgi:hypothetical protein
MTSGDWVPSRRERALPNLHFRRHRVRVHARGPEFPSRVCESSLSALRPVGRRMSSGHQNPPRLFGSGPLPPNQKPTERWAFGSLLNVSCVLTSSFYIFSVLPFRNRNAWSRVFCGRPSAQQRASRLAAAQRS